ncbi:YbaN family protein [Virgibacillus salarius]|uniref:YbaN family protein n=1 Tax=Virgibacillus salarius TaxID=447199 RepID=UPI002490F165|nr:YbaN family protein [Virgibacillus salarius]WBX81607.1 YbaN family protein [Virgibacillus salarius]
MTKLLLTICGTFSLGLGVLGIVVPILPTTPFLLLSAACYAKGSLKLYHWLLANRLFGPYIQNYRSGKGIPLKVKIVSILFLWLSLSYSIIFIIPLISIKFILLLVGLFFTGVILKQKTYRSRLHGSV